MFLRSFKFAIQGIVSAVRSERNLRIMLTCFVFVIAASVLLDLSGTEWAILLICCAGTISIEMINTSIESVINMITPDYNLPAEKAKDIAAGAVLIFSVISVIIALIITIPHIIKLCTCL